MAKLSSMVDFSCELKDTDVVTLISTAFNHDGDEFDSPTLVKFPTVVDDHISLGLAIVEGSDVEAVKELIDAIKDLDDEDADDLAEMKNFLAGAPRRIWFRQLIQPRTINVPVYRDGALIGAAPEHNYMPGGTFTESLREAIKDLKSREEVSLVQTAITSSCESTKEMTARNGRTSTQVQHKIVVRSANKSAVSPSTGRTYELFNYDIVPIE